MTRGRWTPRVCSDRGSSAVEFAFILPVLLLFLFGIIDFGRLQFARIQVTAAAFEGARASGQHLALASVTSAVTAAAGGTTVTIESYTNLSCTVAGTETTVTVRQPGNFRFYTPFLRNTVVVVRSTGAYRCMG